MGDMSAYIPTNVISITDGQIFLEEELFHSGMRPAINAGLSVSRVGGAAQYPAMRAVSGRLHLEMAQFRELAAFAQFGTELDPETQKTLDRGIRVREVLRQDQHAPVAWEDQVAILYAVTHGYLADIPLDDIKEFEDQFISFLHERRQGLRNAITIQRELSAEIERSLQETIADFKKREMALA